jgi:uncharacterized protein (TIGR02145 family)
MTNQNYFKLLLLFLVSSTAFAQVQKAQTLQIGNTSANTPNSSAALQIDDTTRGLLTPRMTTTQRDAISSPVNGLLIFNTTNNNFEVFKTRCSCWVTVYDGGYLPASSLVNTAPSAKNVFLSGQYLVGKTVTLNYTYFDGQLDPEGLTTFQWQISGSNNGSNVTNIAGATSATYVPVTTNAGNYIRAVVTPRATTGVKNGVDATTDWVLVDGATTPTANNLVVTGTPAQGSDLTASYTFAGGSGTENVSLTGTQYVWQTASTALGDNVNNAPLYGASDYVKKYNPQSDLLGRFIRVAVKTKDSNGLQASNFVNSPWVGPITTALEAGPIASGVTYSPAPAVNLTLTGTYSYSDINNDPQGTPSYQWYLADDVNGLNQTAIAGATNATFTVPPSAGNKYVGFAVTPSALTGTTAGTSSAVYYNPNVTKPIATFTFTGTAIKQLPFFTANKIMTALENAIQVEINVTGAGGLLVTSPVVNGYTFSTNLTVGSGIQWITLVPTGTQSAYNSTGDIFTITGVGTTTETKSVNIKHTKLGADFTSHFNGWVSGSNATPNATSYTVGETFNNNSTCTTKPVSTSACPSGNTVTGASGTVYPTVSINGQCWMKTNLKEIPSNFASIPPTSFTSNVDYGGWGYYNTTTTNGSAGYATTEQVANYGMLYQWTAAMNGATNERAQGACPTGWHIPSDCEWKYLEHGIGLKLANTDTQYWGRNDTNLSYKLRGEGVNFTNTTNFSGLLTGYRDSAGFISASVDLFMTVSTKSGNIKMARRSTVAASGAVSGAWAREVDTYLDTFAISVRCLKD